MSQKIKIIKIDPAARTVTDEEIEKGLAATYAAIGCRLVTHYRSLPRISNSDLSEFENFVFGRKTHYSQKALSTGQELHRHLLERHTIGPCWEPEVDMAQVRRMARAGRRDPFLKWVIQFSQKEQVRLWRDPETGLLLKSKLDMVYKDRLVVDLKSTSARSEAAFLKDCLRYGYDRQAAFYLDAIARAGGPRRRFALVAIQKKKPFSVYRIEFADDSDFIAGGRRKYRFLLDELARRQRQGIPFIPSSWAAAEDPTPTPQTLTAA